MEPKKKKQSFKLHNRATISSQKKRLNLKVLWVIVQISIYLSLVADRHHSPVSPLCASRARQMKDGRDLCSSFALVALKGSCCTHSPPHCSGFTVSTHPALRLKIKVWKAEIVFILLKVYLLARLFHSSKFMWKHHSIFLSIKIFCSIFKAFPVVFKIWLYLCRDLEQFLQ